MPGRPELLAVMERVLRDQPAFHGEGTVSWQATEGTLEAIVRSVGDGARTAETGAGASTVLFAAAGAHHTAISPAPDEHARIAEYCEQIGVRTDRLEFVAEPSERVVPTLDGELDFVFIDGAHSFPVPVVDWCYLSRLLAVGGALLLDDVPIPAVRTVYDFMIADPAWEEVEVLDARAVLFRKRAGLPEHPGDIWRAQPFNRSFPDYSFLPVAEQARHRARWLARRAVATVDRHAPSAGRMARRIAGRG